ncbi:MAG: hypothetical protein ACREC0_07805 [Methylocella sp.]
MQKRCTAAPHRAEEDLQLDVADVDGLRVPDEAFALLDTMNAHQVFMRGSVGESSHAGSSNHVWRASEDLGV